MLSYHLISLLFSLIQHSNYFHYHYHLLFHHIYLFHHYRLYNFALFFDIFDRKNRFFVKNLNEKLKNNEITEKEYEEIMTLGKSVLTK